MIINEEQINSFFFSFIFNPLYSMIVTLSLWYDKMLLQDIGMLSTYNLQKRCKEKWEGIVMRCGHWPIWQTIVPPPTRVFAYHHTKLHVWLHSSFVFVAHSLQHAELHHATLIFDQPPRVGQSELNKFHYYLKYQQVIYVMNHWWCIWLAFV